MILAAQSSRILHAAPHEAPHWVYSLLSSAATGAILHGDIPLQVTQSRRFALIRADVSNAHALDPAAVEQRVADAYRAIAKVCGDSSTPHPVRFWNCIPDIHHIDNEGIERYMRFNAGRYRAFSEWFGSDAFARRVPAASAVGYDGNDLVIYALCAAKEGIPVANPRQVAPYRYSQRYGPLPPCFARATIIEPTVDRHLLLVGGTASIRGEETVHLQSLAQQTQETFENLIALIHRGAGILPAHTESRRQDACATESTSLNLFRELRVFIPRAADRDVIAAAITDAFPKASRIELVNADLCRSDLLIEIEGIAELKG